MSEESAPPPSTETETDSQDAALAEEVFKIQQEVAQMEQKMDELEKRITALLLISERNFKF